MINHVMQPLAQKVTQEEIDGFAHDPENHYGSSTDFKGVYNFLQEMGAFTKAAIVAFDIYGDGPLNEETEAMKRAGKSPQTAGHRRLDGLRYGRRSFTPREAQYFHDAFRQVCGDEWADAVSPKEFVTQPISLTMTQLVASGLPAQWETLNPVHALRMLSLASDGSDHPSIRIQRYSDDRLSRQGSGVPVSLEPTEEWEKLKIGEEFRICIEDLPELSDFIVVEYLHESMRGEETAGEIQGQVMHYTRRSGSSAYVSAEDGKPLKVEPTLGRFGFCMITFPTGQNERTNLLDAQSDYLSPETLRTVVQALRRHVVDRSIKVTMFDYEVCK